MHHLSFRALANDVNSTESSAKLINILSFDCINEMSSRSSDEKLKSQGLYRDENNFFY